MRTQTYNLGEAFWIYLTCQVSPLFVFCLIQQHYCISQTSHDRKSDCKQLKQAETYFLIHQGARRWGLLAFVLWLNDMRVAVSALLLAFLFWMPASFSALGRKNGRRAVPETNLPNPHCEACINLDLLGQNFVAWQPYLFLFHVYFLCLIKKRKFPFLKA